MSGNTDQLGNPALVLKAAQAAKAVKGTRNKTGESPAMQKAMRLLLAAGLTVGTGGLLFLLGRAIVRGANYRATINDTDDPSSPDYFAQRLYQAMHPDSPGGWGTDEELIRATVKAVPHLKFWEKVKRSYAKLTKGGNLMADLAADLSRSEKRGVDMILAVLPANEQEARSYDPQQVTPAKLQAWAHRIKAAADHESNWLWPYGTDEAAIYEVINELPSLSAICQLDQTYRSIFGKGLFTELSDELDGDELMHVYELVGAKTGGNIEAALNELSRCLPQT